MEIRYDRSKGKSTTPDDVDDLLECRMKALGLDVDAIGRNYGELFDRIKNDCESCGDRGGCALDLKRNPDSLVWEAYCPVSDVLYSLRMASEWVPK